MFIGLESSLNVLTGDGVGWHKGKKVTLNKAQRQTHSSPNTHSTATPATKTKGQANNHL